MKFYLQWDARGRSRAYRQYGHGTSFSKVNHAIDELKKKEHSHKLVFQDDDSSTRSTLMFFEGTLGQGNFTARKLSTLIKVGTFMYVPKSIVRKTSRKRKRRCKKSKNSTVSADSVKSIPLDFNSPS